MISTIFGASINPSTSVEQYNAITASVRNSWLNSIGSKEHIITEDCDISDFYFQCSGQAVTGSYDITITKNGVDTALTINISGSEQQKADTTHTVSFSKGDKIAIHSVPNSPLTNLGYTFWNLKVTTTTDAQPIPFGSESVPSNSAARYLNILGASRLGSPMATTETYVAIPMPTAGTFKNLYLKFGAPGAGKSMAFTLMKNGSPTALEIVLSDTDTEGNDLVNTVHFDAGDTVSMRYNPTGTPSYLFNTLAGIVFVPDNPSENIASFSNNATPSTASTVYEQPTGYGYGAWSATEGDRSIIVGPYKVTKMRALLQTAPGSGKSYDFTIRKNTANTTLTINIANTDLTGNIASQVSYDTYDYLSIQSVPNSTPATLTGGVHIAFVIDTSQAASDERDFQIPAKDNLSNERDIEIPVKDTASDERDFTLQGKDIANTERDIEIPVEDVANDERDFEVGVKDTASDERDFELGAKNQANTERDFEMNTDDTSTDERSFEVIVKADIKSVVVAIKKLTGFNVAISKLTTLSIAIKSLADNITITKR